MNFVEQQRIKAIGIWSLSKSEGEAITNIVKNIIIDISREAILQLTMADIGTPPVIANVDDRIMLRRYFNKLITQAEKTA